MHICYISAINAIVIIDRVRTVVQESLIEGTFITAAAGGSEVLSLAEDIVCGWNRGSRRTWEQDREQEKNVDVSGPHIDRLYEYLKQ